MKWLAVLMLTHLLVAAVGYLTSRSKRHGPPERVRIKIR